MTLTEEVKWILLGADPKKLKVRKDGRYTQKTLDYLATNQIPF